MNKVLQLLALVCVYYFSVYAFYVMGLGLTVASWPIVIFTMVVQVVSFELIKRLADKK